MQIVLWILFGAIIGWLASLITGDAARLGAIGNIILGLAGALLGGWIASLLGIGNASDFNLGGLAIAVLGAVFLILLVGFVRGRRI